MAEKPEKAADFATIGGSDGAFMPIPQLASYCEELQTAMAIVSINLRTTTNESEILDSYWGLQDHLHRMVDLVSDSPVLVFELSSLYPTLVRDVVGLLRATRQARFSLIPAVDLCCETINSYLNELEQQKRQDRASAAGK